MIIDDSTANINQGVPALKISLTEVGNGTEVKTSDLTSQGTLEAPKDGGEKMSKMAGKALGILENRSSAWLHPSIIYRLPMKL